MARSPFATFYRYGRGCGWRNDDRPRRRRVRCVCSPANALPTTHFFPAAGPDAEFQMLPLSNLPGPGDDQIMADAAVADQPALEHELQVALLTTPNFAELKTDGHVTAFFGSATEFYLHEIERIQLVVKGIPPTPPRSFDFKRPIICFCRARLWTTRSTEVCHLKGHDAACHMATGCRPTRGTHRTRRALWMHCTRSRCSVSSVIIVV